MTAQDRLDIANRELWLAEKTLNLARTRRAIDVDEEAFLQAESEYRACSMVYDLAKLVVLNIVLRDYPA